MVKVKVCGITNLEDALKAIGFGADALGFNFYPPSPRFISPLKAQSILAELPEEVYKVAVFVNEPREKVEEVLRCGFLPDGRQTFSALQFHGNESAEYCSNWRLEVIKAFRVKDRSSFEGIRGFSSDFYLLDSWAPGYGGSGSPFPWDWIEKLEAERLILAGGLDLQNVAEAVRRVHPYGVDVCTGVESRPGIKDHEKLKEFIRAAKDAR